MISLYYIYLNILFLLKSLKTNIYMSEELKENFKQLKYLYTYIKKAANVKLSEKTLNKKLDEARLIHGIILSQVNLNSDANLCDADVCIQESNIWIEAIESIIRRKINKLHKLSVIPRTTLNFTRLSIGKKSTMSIEQSETRFDVRQACLLIQPYNGDSGGLNAFVDSVELLKELTSDNQKLTAIKFIKSRLSGKARNN